MKNLKFTVENTIPWDILIFPQTKTTKETYVYSTNVNNINLSDDVKTIYDDYSPALYNFSSKAFNGLAGVWKYAIIYNNS